MAAAPLHYTQPVATTSGEKFGLASVCGEAVNGLEAVEKVELFTPDLAILDLGMPVMNGVGAAREIAKTHPQLPLLLISVQELSP